MEYARKAYNLICKITEFKQQGLMSKIQDTETLYVTNLLNAYSFVGLTDSQKLRLESELDRITNNISAEGFFDDFTFGQIFNQ